MTVQATPRKAGPFVGNNVSAVFAFSFKTRSADHLKVIRADLTGVETTLLLNSQYTVALNADQEAMPGGSITLSAPLALNYKLTILSLVPYAQTTDVPGSGVIPPAVLEDTLDLLVMQTQQLAEESARSVKVLPTSGTNPDTLLPDAVAATAASASAASSSATTAAGSASAAATSATNAATSATNAAGSATSAATSATNAASSATSAAASAASAATSASNLASAWRATSTSSLAIGTGSKTFTTQAGKLFEVGSFVMIALVGTPTSFMFGQVTAYSGTSLTVSVALASGTGTFADWTITVSGARGADGAVTSVTAGDGTITIGGTASAPTVRVAANTFQPLDAELTAIAGLSAAADMVPYFTGAGSAALATFTAAGRALVDDADAAAQRATLGLGTAATQNTGTSGAVVPLLSTANVWGGVQTVSMGAEVYSELWLYRNDPSPTAGDLLGWVQGRGKNTGGADTVYGTVNFKIGNATTGSEAGTISISTQQTSGYGERITISNGVAVGVPAGGDKGIGTINAQAVYDDNTLLTCYIIEAEVTGAIDLAKWDALTPNSEIPARDAQTEVRAVPVLDKTGKPVLDKGRPVMREEVVETIPAQLAQTIVRTHEPARRFAARAEMMLDPKQYGEFWRTNGHLPSMPSPDEWVAADHKLSTGDLIQRLWEVVEVQTVHIEKLRQRVEALEAKLP